MSYQKLDCMVPKVATFEDHRYKRLYFGSAHTQYNVVIAMFKAFRDAIKEVEGFDEQLMKFTIISSDRTIHFFAACAPYTCNVACLLAII